MTHTGSVAISPGLGARLAGEPPAAESITPGPAFPLGPCDVTASGAEDAQVRLIRDVSGLPFRELCFCGHHANELALGLIANGWILTHDYRSGLA